MQEWEYQFEVQHQPKGSESLGRLEERMQQLGKSGWELCGILPTEVADKPMFVYIFKRPRKQ